MQAQRPPLFIWYVGKTRRERVAAALAVMGFCAALFWALLNDLSYGYEGAVPPPSLLHTNGRFATSLVLGVFFSCVAVSALGVLLFWCFCFLDRNRK
jgi:hypothetical protein